MMDNNTGDPASTVFFFVITTRGDEFVFFTRVAIVIPKRGLVGRTVKTFHSRATTQEASFHLHGCHLTAVSLGVILTRGERPVRVGHFPVNSKICHEWTK